VSDIGGMFFHGSIFSLEDLIFRVIVINIYSIIVRTYDQHIIAKLDLRNPLSGMFEYLEHFDTIFIFCEI